MTNEWKEVNGLKTPAGFTYDVIVAPSGLSTFTELRDANGRVLIRISPDTPDGHTVPNNVIEFSKKVA